MRDRIQKALDLAARLDYAGYHKEASEIARTLRTAQLDTQTANVDGVWAEAKQLLGDIYTMPNSNGEAKSALLYPLREVVELLAELSTQGRANEQTSLTNESQNLVTEDEAKTASSQAARTVFADAKKFRDYYQLLDMNPQEIQALVEADQPAAEKLIDAFVQRRAQTAHSPQQLEALNQLSAILKDPAQRDRFHQRWTQRQKGQTAAGTRELHEQAKAPKEVPPATQEPAPVARPRVPKTPKPPRATPPTSIERAWSPREPRKLNPYVGRPITDTPALGPGAPSGVHMPVPAGSLPRFMRPGPADSIDAEFRDVPIGTSAPNSAGPYNPMAHDYDFHPNEGTVAPPPRGMRATGHSLGDLEMPAGTTGTVGVPQAANGMRHLIDGDAEERLRQLRNLHTPKLPRFKGKNMLLGLGGLGVLTGAGYLADKLYGNQATQSTAPTPAATTTDNAGNSIRDRLMRLQAHANSALAGDSSLPMINGYLTSAIASIDKGPATGASKAEQAELTRDTLTRRYLAMGLRDGYDSMSRHLVQHQSPSFTEQVLGKWHQLQMPSRPNGAQTAPSQPSWNSANTAAQDELRGD